MRTQRMGSKVLWWAGLCMLVLAAPGMAMAKEWPNRPIRWVVAYPVGGVSDEISRTLAEKLSVQMGVPVQVENRAGAGGAIAMEMLAKAPPDGHTLVFSAISPLVLPALASPLGYDPVADIAPVASVMFTPVLVLGTPALNAQTLTQALELARRQPGRLRWASSGLNTTGHRVMEQVSLLSHTDITHIPYKGGGQQLVDALSGQFELLSSNVGAQQLQYVQSGRLKALAVGSATRLDALPQVPTLNELGFPAANRVSLFGVFAPGKTPPAIINRLNAELNKVLQQADIRQRLIEVGNSVGGGSAADFSKLIAQERQANRLLPDAHKIPVN